MSKVHAGAVKRQEHLAREEHELAIEQLQIVVVELGYAGQFPIADQTPVAALEQALVGVDQHLAVPVRTDGAKLMARQVHRVPEMDRPHLSKRDVLLHLPGRQTGRQQRRQDHEARNPGECNHDGTFLRSGIGKDRLQGGSQILELLGVTRPDRLKTHRSAHGKAEECLLARWNGSGDG